MKRCVLKNFAKFHRKTPVPESLPQYSCRAEACNLIKKEALAHVFSCEFCEIFKNTFLQKNIRTTASAVSTFDNYPISIAAWSHRFLLNVKDAKQLDQKLY